MALVKLLKYANGTIKEHQSGDDITFNSFTGTGSGLTSLNASNISSGTLDKARLDPTMEGNGINFTAGVISVEPKTASGIGVDANGVYVDYDGSTIGIVSNKLATLAAFKTITATTGSNIVAPTGASTLNLAAGTDITVTSDGVSTITIACSGVSAATASLGVQKVGNDFRSNYDSTLGLTGNQLGINLANANVWTAAQTLSGFTGQKLIIDAAAGDTLGTKIFNVKNSVGSSVASIDELGNLICQDLQVNGAETVVGILAGSSLTLSSSLTVSGAAQFNDTVVLGNSTADDITFNGYVASNIIPKAPSATYDLGTSTLKWNYIYAENISNGTKTIDVDNIGDIAAAQTVTGAWTFTGIPDLPLQFKINNVAVSTNVTAANLNTLTAGSGSNADALHTHAAAVAADVQLVFTASGAVAAGQAVYVIPSANNTVAIADADDISTARVIGIAESSISDGATGYITTYGKATIVGASFTVGQPVYLSQTAGDVTSTAPTGVDKIVYEVGIATSATEIVVAPKIAISLS